MENYINNHFGESPFPIGIGVSKIRLKKFIINTIIFTKNLNLQSILFLLFSTRGKSAYHYGFNTFKGPFNEYIKYYQN